MEKLSGDIQDAYAAVAEMGGQADEGGGSALLPAAIRSIPKGGLVMEWETVTMDAGNRSGVRWTGAAYGDGKYVAVSQMTSSSSNSGYSFVGGYSTDGVNWTDTHLDCSGAWSSVVYGAGKFTAASSSCFTFSTNGIDWRQGPSSVSARSLIYEDGKFIALKSSCKGTETSSTGYTPISSSAGHYSTDGKNWTPITLPASRNWSKAAYGSGRFVTVANESFGAYSEDGITWQATTLPETTNWVDVAYGSGRFVAISPGGDVACSTDGINWTMEPKPLPNVATNWGKITYGGGKFVVIAGNKTTNEYATACSEDGVNWTPGVLPRLGKWGSVNYVNGRFLVLAGYDVTNNAAISV